MHMLLNLYIYVFHQFGDFQPTSLQMSSLLHSVRNSDSHTLILPTSSSNPLVLLSPLPHQCCSVFHSEQFSQVIFQMTNFPAVQLLNMCVENSADLNPTRSLELKVGALVDLKNLKKKRNQANANHGLLGASLCSIIMARANQYICGFSSVQSGCSVMSNSLRPQEPQHARPPCPQPIPRVYSNSCPLSQ